MDRLSPERRSWLMSRIHSKDTFALRCYDSVELAARTVQQAAGEPLHFACFDTRLRKAAAILAMAVSSP